MGDEWDTRHSMYWAGVFSFRGPCRVVHHHPRFLDVYGADHLAVGVFFLGGQWGQPIFDMECLFHLGWGRWRVVREGSR